MRNHSLKFINRQLYISIFLFFFIVVAFSGVSCSHKGYAELFDQQTLNLDLTSVGSEVLEQFLLDHLKNKKVAYCQNTGNAGDALIWYGTLCLFKKLGISYTPYHLAIQDMSPTALDVIVFGGGGNFVPYYQHCSTFLKDVMGKGKPVIVLPQTIQGHQRLLRRLLSNVTLFCREQMSYEYCKGIVPYQENVFYTCDLAFFADLTPFQKFKKKDNDPPKNLFAFRCDCEIHKSREGLVLPSSNQDISFTCGVITDTTTDAQNYVVVEKFIKTIDAYDVVWTDRLHVGIGAFMLGKKVHLFDNSYGKVRAVYENTIKPLDLHHQVMFHSDWDIVAQADDRD